MPGIFTGVEHILEIPRAGKLRHSFEPTLMGKTPDSRYGNPIKSVEFYCVSPEFGDWTTAWFVGGCGLVGPLQGRGRCAFVTAVHDEHIAYGLWDLALFRSFKTEYRGCLSKVEGKISTEGFSSL